MPELDYALVADYVRADGGVAHVIGAGISTVYAPEVPTGQNIGFLMRLMLSRNESGRPHRVEVFFQDADGTRLAQITGTMAAEWDEGLPPGWKQPTGIAFNFGVPLPQYGIYSFEILVNDSLIKTIPFRVVPLRPPEG